MFAAFPFLEASIHPCAWPSIPAPGLEAYAYGHATAPAVVKQRTEERAQTSGFPGVKRDLEAGGPSTWRAKDRTLHMTEDAAGRATDFARLRAGERTCCFPGTDYAFDYAEEGGAWDYAVTDAVVVAKVAAEAAAVAAVVAAHAAAAVAADVSRMRAAAVGGVYTGIWRVASGEWRAALGHAHGRESLGRFPTKKWGGSTM
jgi:hypothetical protein